MSHLEAASLQGTLDGLTREVRRLQVSESRYRRLFETARDGILLLNAESAQIEEVNPYLIEMLGYSHEVFLGKKLWEVGPFADIPKSKDMFALLQTMGYVRYEDLPLRSKTGQQIDVEFISNSYECEGVKTIQCNIRDISRRKAADAEITRLAFHDHLTDLPNRRLLLIRLQQALALCGRTKRNGALLFIDLDNFKELNDSRGHDVGDLMLQEVAHRLATCVRESDTVARLGGDEFVVMLEGLDEDAKRAATQSTFVGDKIIAALSKPYLLDTQKSHGSASIGANMFGSRRESAGDVLKQADIAMYQAKAEGRNNLRFFDAELQAAVKARATMDAEMRQAIEQDQFVLYYQPQVDGDGRVTGAEALVRWQHPSSGLVFPMEFIPLAEENGLILPLGRWILETACAQMVAWARRPDTAHLTLAVNVSARQFHQIDFVNQVRTIVTRTGADPCKLKLELTESLLLVNIEDVISKMILLNDQGIRLSLDDFGTGFSSLTYLKRLPISQLKVDKSFVRNILTDFNDSTISLTVLKLGQSFGLEVIAEGVETEAQRDLLAGHGCHAFQGYLFGRPMPIDQFDHRLATDGLLLVQSGTPAADAPPA